MGSPQSSGPQQPQCVSNRTQPSVAAAPVRHVVDTFGVCQSIVAWRLPTTGASTHANTLVKFQVLKTRTNTIDFGPSTPRLRILHVVPFIRVAICNVTNDKTSVCCQEDDATAWCVLSEPSEGFIYDSWVPKECYCYLSFVPPGTHGSITFYSI